MSPSETTAQAQAQDEHVLESEPESVNEGDGEENRSQLEAKDDAALLVCLFMQNFPCDLCRTYADLAEVYGVQTGMHEFWYRRRRMNRH